MNLDSKSTHVNQKLNIMFIGLDYNVVKTLLNNSKLTLTTLNVIHDFICIKTRNPINLLFQNIYRDLIKHSATKSFKMYVWRFLKNLSTGVFYQYRDYLVTLVENEISLFDIENPQNTKDFIISQPIDLIVVSNWWILPDEIIFAPRLGTVNIHPSILPQYRGSVPTLWSLKNKDRQTAVTFMLLSTKMDVGDILEQEMVSIDTNDDAISLEKKLDAVIRKSLNNILDAYISGDLKPKSQDNSKATYTAKYYEYLEIKPRDETAQDIVNKVLLYPHLWRPDMCYLRIHDRKIPIKDAIKVSDNYEKGPGVYRSGINLIIVCKIGVVSTTLFKDVSVRDSVDLLLKLKLETI